MIIAPPLAQQHVRAWESETRIMGQSLKTLFFPNSRGQNQGPFNRAPMYMRQARYACQSVSLGLKTDG